MKRIIHVALVMLGLWLLLSGHYSVLLVSLGIVSAINVSLLCAQLSNTHHHVVDLPFFIRLFRYLPWLAKEIVMSNIDVARRIWSPKNAINPSIIRPAATQKTDLGIAIYANSITLTPGTLTLEIHDDEIEVHSLATEIGDQLMVGDMNARVKRIEGQP